MITNHRTHLPSFRPYIVLVASILVCIGCSLTRIQPRSLTTYVLQPSMPSPESQENSTPSSKGLVVHCSSTLQDIATTRILFTRDQLSIGWYQFARWDEPVTQKLRDIVVSALTDQKIFEQVSVVDPLRRSRWTLELEINTFAHNAQSNPGEVTIEIDASIWRTSVPTPQTSSFTYRIPVASYNAEGAVAAFHEGVERFLEEIIPWVRAQTKR